MKVQVLLSIASGQITDAQRQLVHSSGGEWEVLETNILNRDLVHAIVDFEQIEDIKTYLTNISLFPKLIGVWDEQGLQHETADIPSYPIDLVELLLFSPGAHTTHQFGGWEIVQIL